MDCFWLFLETRDAYVFVVGVEEGDDMHEVFYLLENVRVSLDKFRNYLMVGLALAAIANTSCDLIDFIIFIINFNLPTWLYQCNSLRVPLILQTKQYLFSDIV